MAAVVRTGLCAGRGCSLVRCTGIPGAPPAIRVSVLPLHLTVLRTSPARYATHLAMPTPAQHANSHSLAALQLPLTAALPTARYRYATHLVRRLLCIAAGRDVLPPKKQRDRGGAAPGQDGAPANGPAKGKGGPAKAHGLGAKLGPGAGASAAEQPPAAFPSLLQPLLDALMAASGEHMAVLATNMYSSPFLQAAVSACAGDWQVRRMTPCLL
jgi:hypothetical protein